MQRIYWIAAAVASAAWAASAFAAGSAAPSAGEAVNAGLETSAKRVVRDKETGKLRAPTEGELSEMLEQERTARAASGKSEDSVPLVVRQFPNGMRSAVLGPDFLVTIKAQRRPDGTVVLSHDRAAHEHAGGKPLPTE